MLLSVIIWFTLPGMLTTFWELKVGGGGGGGGGGEQAPFP